MNGRKIVTLSLPFDLLKEVQSIAKDERLSRSELFSKAMLDFIGRYRWDKAGKAAQKTVREMKISESDIEGIVHDFRKK